MAEVTPEQYEKVISELRAEVQILEQKLKEQIEANDLLMLSNDRLVREIARKSKMFEEPVGVSPEAKAAYLAGYENKKKRDHDRITAPRKALFLQELKEGFINIESSAGRLYVQQRLLRWPEMRSDVELYLPEFCKTAWYVNKYIGKPMPR